MLLPLWFCSARFWHHWSNLPGPLSLPGSLTSFALCNSGSLFWLDLSHGFCLGMASVIFISAVPPSHRQLNCSTIVVLPRKIHSKHLVTFLLQSLPFAATYTISTHFGFAMTTHLSLGRMPRLMPFVNFVMPLITINLSTIIMISVTSLLLTCQVSIHSSLRAIFQECILMLSLQSSVLFK